MHVQMTLDRHLATGAGGEVAGQGAAEPVPGEEGEEHRHGDGENRPQAHCAKQPQSLAPVGPGVLDAGLGAVPPAAEAGADALPGPTIRICRGGIGHKASKVRAWRWKAPSTQIVPGRGAGCAPSLNAQA